MDKYLKNNHRGEDPDTLHEIFEFQNLNQINIFLTKLFMKEDHHYNHVLIRERNPTDPEFNMDVYIDIFKDVPKE